MTAAQLLLADADENDALGDEAGALPVIRCAHDDCDKAPGMDMCFACAVSDDDEATFASYMLHGKAA